MYGHCRTSASLGYTRSGLARNAILTGRNYRGPILCVSTLRVPEGTKLMLETVLIAVLSSATVSTILVVFVNNYLKRLIDHEFIKRELDVRLTHENQKHVSQRILGEQVGVFTELVELAYRIKVILREGIEKERITEWDMSLRPLASHLTDSLFRYRYFLPADLFDPLHEFKHSVQDIAMVVDTLTREEFVFDSQAYAGARAGLTPKVETAIEQAERIQAVIREHSERLSGRQHGQA